MAGFLGLGGGSSESFFLEPDDAKTMGDIDYMRTAKKVKRTFAKTKGWGDIGASEKAVSAYDARGGEATSSRNTPSYTPAPSSFSAPATPSYTPPQSTPTYTPPQATPTYTPPQSTPTFTPPVSESAPASTPVAETESTLDAAPAPAPQASSGGDDMDMFRAMARKIR